MSVLTVLVALLVLFPGLVTAMSRARKIENNLFLGISASLSAWVVTNYLVDAFSGTALLFTRITFLTITIGSLFFWDFSSFFPSRSKHLAPRNLVYPVGLIVCVIVMTPWFIPKVNIEDGVANVVPGFLYPVFVVYFAALISLALIRLWLNIKRSRGARRQQSRMVLFGFAAMTSVGATTNLILPLILGSNTLAPFGTFSTLILTGFIGYAMVRHRLFDIRAAVTRAAAYTLTLGVLVLIYVLLIYTVTEIFGEQAVSGGSGRIAFVGFALFAALSFERLKRLFDRLTNAIFYRDAYDSNKLLDELSGFLVGELDLKPLTLGAADLMAKYIRPEFVAFFVVGQEESNRIISNKPVLLEASALRELRHQLREKELTHLRLDELEANSDIARLMRKQKISFVHLLSTHTDEIGLVMFGEKRSGDTYGNRDTQVIGIASDEIALAIENSLRFEQIRGFNVRLQREVEDATSELRRANTKLKALDETKDDFISMASHQLRTPLTSVKGYLSMVLEGDAGQISEKQKELLGQSFSSSQRMVYLISDLLNVSRLKTGKFIIEPTEVNLPAIIEEEISQVRELANIKKQTLNYKKPENFPAVQLDDNKIRQVIMNFIDNAIHYTPDGGIIDISLTSDDKKIELTVSDNGIGVPKSEQPRLFSKFYRAANAKAARPDGTGIGLFMAKKVIIASGGALIFKSQEGKGSVFGFTFPLRHVKKN